VEKKTIEDKEVVEAGNRKEGPTKDVLRDIDPIATSLEGAVLARTLLQKKRGARTVDVDREKESARLKLEENRLRINELARQGRRAAKEGVPIDVPGLRDAHGDAQITERELKDAKRMRVNELQRQRRAARKLQETEMEESRRTKRNEYERNAAKPKKRAADGEADGGSDARERLARRMAWTEEKRQQRLQGLLDELERYLMELL
jgi:hypothetical protein